MQYTLIGDRAKDSFVIVRVPEKMIPVWNQIMAAAIPKMGFNDDQPH